MAEIAENIWSTARETVTKILNMFGGVSAIFAGILLVVYFALFIVFSLGALSAHQLQYSIQASQVGGRALSLSEIARAQSQLDELDHKITKLEYEIGVEEPKLKGGIKLGFNPIVVIGIIQGKKDEILVFQNKKIEILKFGTSDPNAKIEDLINFRRYLQDFEGSQISFFNFPGLSINPPNFSQMPPQFLTLLLVLSMGALGGTIHLTKLFMDRFRGREYIALGMVRSGSYYIFRPILGAVIGFCVFVLAKAGVLVVSLPTTPGGSTPLNPFFVSFLGIISGLLAEEALGTIRRTGSAWFSSTETSTADRWVLPHGALEKLGKDGDAKTKLARQLGETVGTLQLWLDGEESIPVHSQRIIAAWVNEPVRVLFSDIKEQEEKKESS